MQEVYIDEISYTLVYDSKINNLLDSKVVLNILVLEIAFVPFMSCNCIVNFPVL